MQPHHRVVLQLSSGSRSHLRDGVRSRIPRNWFPVPLFNLYASLQELSVSIHSLRRITVRLMSSDSGFPLAKSCTEASNAKTAFGAVNRLDCCNPASKRSEPNSSPASLRHS